MNRLVFGDGKSSKGGGSVYGGSQGTQSDGTAGRRGTRAQQKKKIVKEGVDILTMNADRPLVDTESTLEYILNTLCRAFEMKPKQAAALLTNNNQFLIHSIVKGIKGQY